MNLLNFNNTKAVLFFLLLFSLAIKLVILSGSEVVNVDAVRYLNAAQMITEGHFSQSLAVERMPIYPLLIALMHIVVHDWELAGKLISIVAMVFALIPLYLLTRELFDEQAAFWAGMAFSLSPLINKHAVEVLRDPVFILLAVCAVWYCVRSVITPGIPLFLYCLLLSLLAVLFRIEAVFLIPMVLMSLIMAAITSKQNRLSYVKGILLFTAPPMLLMLVIMAGIGTDLTLRFADVNAYFSNIYSLKFLDSYRFIYAKLKDFENLFHGGDGTASFTETARHYLPVLYLIGLIEAVARNLFPFFVLPLAVSFLSKPPWKRGHYVLLLFSLGFLLVAYLHLIERNFISKRYVLLPAVLLMPWAGYGLKMLWQRATSSRFPKAAIVVFLMIFCLAPAYKSIARTSTGGDVVKVAGQWLASIPELQEVKIITTDERIPFYAGLGTNFTPLPPGDDYPVMERRASSAGHDLLIIEISIAERDSVPDFIDYGLIKEFADKKNMVLVFQRRS
jgi:4-amino-4-deoxy-L-arabinose transferase-like glycosyltransferase